MQMKTTTRYHFTPTRTAVIKKDIKRSVGKDVEKLESSHTADRNIKEAAALENTLDVS